MSMPSLVWKKIFWLFKKSILYFFSYLIINKNDVILSLFPKTGSTWIRFFLFNYLNETESLEIKAGIDQMNAVMPEFGHKSMLNQWRFKSSPKLIKTHRPFRSIFSKNKIILVIRDPRDILVSFYHYALAKKEFNFSGTLKDIIHHNEWGLEYFFEQFKSWEKYAGLIVKYEDLKADPKKSFKEILSYMDIPVDEEALINAIHRSDFNAM
ncbi:MAG: hypothetical protein CML12_02275, partial [Puniceicoccaceae bacterium]|nr:hypothetical protein [Puniceicoccaceae bacterium]